MHSNVNHKNNFFKNVGLEKKENKQSLRQSLIMEADW